MLSSDAGRAAITYHQYLTLDRSSRDIRLRFPIPTAYVICIIVIESSRRLGWMDFIVQMSTYEAFTCVSLIHDSLAIASIGETMQLEYGGHEHLNLHTDAEGLFGRSTCDWGTAWGSSFWPIGGPLN